MNENTDMTTAATKTSSSLFVNTPDKFTNTHMECDVLVRRTKDIIEFIRTSKMGISLEGDGMTYVPGISSTDVMSDLPKYPIICIINGAGSNGKDTFIEGVGKNCSVASLSSITEVKAAAELLIGEVAKVGGYYPLSLDPREDPVIHCDEKSDEYRGFLHDIKTAWVNFFDGPNTVMLGKMCELLSRQKAGAENYDVIFLTVREPSEIKKLTHIIKDIFRLVCISVIVEGRVSPDEYVNTADAGVNDYDYDIHINNSGTQSSLELRAQIFGLSIIQANRIHGVDVHILNAMSTGSVAFDELKDRTLVGAADTGDNDTTSKTVLTGAADETPEKVTGIIDSAQGSDPT